MRDPGFGVFRWYNLDARCFITIAGDCNLTARCASILNGVVKFEPPAMVMKHLASGFYYLNTPNPDPPSRPFFKA